MPNFRVLGYVDCFRLVASLHSRQGIMKEGRQLLLRATGDWLDEVVDDKWTAVKNIVSRIERTHGNGRFERGGVTLLSIPPHSGTDWENNPDWQTLHLPILTNPSVRVHSGLDATNIPVGLLTWVDSAPLGCMINHGDYLAAHLVIEFRSKHGQS